MGNQYSHPQHRHNQRDENYATGFSYPRASMESIQSGKDMQNHYNRRGGKPRGGMRGGRSGMEDGSGGMNRDLTSGGGRGGYSGRGGYHQGGYRGGSHGAGGIL